MKKIFTLFFILLCLCSAVKTSAQALYAVSADEKIQQSTLIVEGRVIKQESFWNPRHTMIYTSSTVKVYKKFKGDTNPAFIEVLTQGGSVGLENITASDLLELGPDQTGVFFCHPNSIGLRNPSTNALLMDVTASTQGFLEYNKIDGSANAPFARYKSITGNLYTELQAKTGRSYTVTDGSFIPPAAPTGNIVSAVSITGFTPTTVNAGATLDPGTNLLTINGSGFGTASGTASIYFDDANDGTAGNYIQVLYSDNLVVSWTATQIQVRVPSRAGTGLIYVQEDAGSPVSGGILTINYSVLTATFTVAPNTVTKESNLMNDNSLGGYSILYSTSTANSGVDLNAAPAKATFQRALTTWQQLAGFNVVEAGTTASQQVSPSDGNNVIMYDNLGTGNLPLATGVLAVCYSFNSMCTPVLTNQIRKTEFDIVIRNAGVSTGSTSFTLGPCPPATPEIDMETVLLHELGHALNLGHINDSYQGSALPQINPGKLMNYAIVNGVKRTSPDYAAYAGALYCTMMQGNLYGACVAAPLNTEMTKLGTTIDAKDECPVTFPAGSVGGSFGINLAYATSNKYADPQPAAVNCAGTITGVTATAYHAFKTNNVAGSVSLSVSSYATTPAAQSACSGAGVRLTLYQTASCPTGQAFPTPIACRTFNADGALAAFTGLAANTYYLLMMSGIDNTKGSFTLTLSGSVLPVKFSNFAGSAQQDNNRLVWNLENTEGAYKTILEASIDGVHFAPIDEKTNTLRAAFLNDGFNDYQLASKKYYRLKIVNLSGAIEYSSTVLLNRGNTKTDIIISPNPASEKLNVMMSRPNSGPVTFTIFDMAGKQLSQETRNLLAGSVTVPITSVSKLAAGTYFLKINDGEKISSHRFLISN